MPVSQLGIQHFVLSLLQRQANARPASTNGLGVVVDTAFVSQSLCNLSLLVSCLLHADDELVIGVEVCGDFLRQCWTATSNLQSLRIRGRRFFA